MQGRAAAVSPSPSPSLDCRRCLRSKSAPARARPQETEADTRVVGLFEGETPDDDAVRPLAESGEAKGGLRKLAVTHEDGGRRVIVVGLGKRDEFDHERARVAAGAAAQRARELGAKALSWAAPEGAGAAAALVEGTLLALYEFKQFKSSHGDDDDGERHRVARGRHRRRARGRGGRAARIRAEAANAARDLQNMPANVATPTFLAERAKALADEHEALSFEVLGPRRHRRARHGRVRLGGAGLARGARS